MTNKNQNSSPQKQPDLEIRIDGKTLSMPYGTEVRDILVEADVPGTYPVLVAMVNNKIVDLAYRLKRNSTVTFLHAGDREGMRAYHRSLIFVLTRAARKLYPDRRLMVDQALGFGLYCHFEDGRSLTNTQIQLLEEEMRGIVRADEPFLRENLPRKLAIARFAATGQIDKVRLLNYISRRKVSIYHFGDHLDYFHGPLVPSAGHLEFFTLKNYRPGFLLCLPSHREPTEIPQFVEQPKLFEVFQEHERWGAIMSISDVGSLNEAIHMRKIRELISVAEAIHEKRLAQIADRLEHLRRTKRIILVSGPSSSGKTTFCKRLAIHLRVNGINSNTISLDDYFVDRDRTPRDEKGNLDYEALGAIDVELFNQHLLRLLDGEIIEPPSFDFHQGRRLQGKRLSLRENEMLIVEGIHGLNEELTPSISPTYKLKIYVSALTHLNLDNHNRIPTTDTRLIRRIVRDSLFRSYTARETLKRWPLVRRGETRWIFPYQEQADIMFNSALFYELTVLKPFAERELREVTGDDEICSEARRLIKFLSFFRSTRPDPVPPTSILREFIGRSIFRY